MKLSCRKRSSTKIARYLVLLLLLNNFLTISLQAAYAPALSSNCNTVCLPQEDMRTLMHDAGCRIVIGLQASRLLETLAMVARLCDEHDKASALRAIIALAQQGYVLTIEETALCEPTRHESWNGTHAGALKILALRDAPYTLIALPDYSDVEAPTITRASGSAIQLDSSGNIFIGQDPVATTSIFNVKGAASGPAVKCEAGSGQAALTLTGSSATAMTITPGTNQIGFTMTGNGTANAMQITAGAGAGGGILTTGGAGAGVPLQVVATAGTGNGATFSGNASSPTVSVTSNAAQNSIIASLGAVGTPAYSFIGDTNTGIYSPGADQIRMVTAGSDRLRIDASGNTTFTSNYKAAAHRITSNQTISGTSSQAIQFNGEIFDPNNNFDSTTDYAYTAPVTGYYTFMANISKSAFTAGSKTIQLYKDTGGGFTAVTGYIVTGSDSNTISAPMTLVGIVSLNANDKIRIQYQGANGDGIAIGSSFQISFLSIQLMQESILMGRLVK